MNLGRLLLVALLGLMGLTTWCSRHDWYGDGPAVLPASRGEIQTDLVRVTSLLIAGQDGLKEPITCRRRQIPSIQVTAQCEPSRFEVTRSVFSLSKRPPATAPRLLRSSVFLRLLRRSSHGDGSKLVSGAGSGARIAKNNVLTWTGGLRTPDVPGTYLLEVRLLATDRPATGEPQRIEQLIAEIPIEVAQSTAQGSAAGSTDQ